MSKKNKNGERNRVHTVKIDGADGDDDDDILGFGVAAHALVREVSLLTAMIVLAIMVAVGGGACKRASGLINARVSLKMRENLEVSLMVVVG